MIVLGIDCGANGGLAYHLSVTVAVKMPSSRKEIFKFLEGIKAKGELTVFIEKVQLFGSDKGGKQFGIMKLLANFESVVTCLEILDIPYVLVPAQTWQKELNLQKRKGEEKTDRKRRYAEYARTFFPEMKVTLQTADALCLLIFGKKMLKLKPDWVNERINQNESDLFN